MHFIIVFASRTASFRFHDILLKRNISASVIATPREASLGCGVCVKFQPADYEAVKEIYIQQRDFKQGFFYKVIRNGIGYTVSKL